MYHDENDDNSFALDDEDMDLIMKEAAEAGSAAVDEQHGVSDDIFSENDDSEDDFEVDNNVSEPEVVDEKSDIVGSEETSEVFGNEEEFNLDDIDGISVSEEPKKEKIQSSTPKSSSSFEKNSESQKLYARSVIDVSDEYRKLDEKTQSVVSQLITQEEDADEVDVIVEAINSDDLILETMRSLLEAKNKEQVDRAFYLLKLNDDVRNSISELCKAFVDSDFQESEGLDFSRQLFDEIEKLDDEIIQYVSSTESVLRAAKNT